MITQRGRMMVAASAALLILNTALFANEFFIVPDAFAIASGGTISAFGHSTMHFPAGESTVQPDRVQDARIIGASWEARITGLSVEGKSLRLHQPSPSDGQYIIAIALAPRVTRVATAAFQEMLQQDGSPDEAARIEREGFLAHRDTVVYRTLKFATTIVEVGRGSRAFKKRAAYGLEFQPAADPSTFATGVVKVRLLGGGKPMAGWRVHVGAAADSVRRATGIDPDQHLLTDAKGLVTLSADCAGWWNVRASRVVPSADSTVQFDVQWATYVFHVREATSVR